MARAETLDFVIIFKAPDEVSNSKLVGIDKLKGEIMSFGHALYYPHIHLKNKNWLKNAFLFWDKISRIVPESIDPSDDEDVIRLCQESDFIKNYSPESYVTSSVFNEFSNQLLRRISSQDFMSRRMVMASSQEEQIRYRNFLNRSSRNRRNFFRTRTEQSGDYIHVEKMDRHLKTMLTDLGLCIPGEDAWEDWVKIDSEIGELYMSCLAKKISLDKSLPIVTDSIDFYSTSMFYENNKNYYNTQLERRLGNILIASYLPQNINTVTFSQLIDFKKKYESERLEFFNYITQLCSSVSEISSTDALDDAINHYLPGLKNSAENLRKAYESHKIETVVKYVAASVLFQLPAYIESVPTEWKGLGIASGILLGVTSQMPSVNREQTELQSRPLSYLLNISSELSGKNLLQRIDDSFSGMRRW